MEALQGRDGDKDDNSLLAVANLDLIKIPSQHASSRTKPWTASRPVPQKSMILRLGTASRLDDMGRCAPKIPQSPVSKTSLENCFYLRNLFLDVGRERCSARVARRSSGHDGQAIARTIFLCGNRISRRNEHLGFYIYSSRYSHLTGRDELQRSEGDLEIGGVGLEVEESLGDARFELGGVLPRGAVGSDLVKGLGAHFDGWFDYVIDDDGVEWCCEGRCNF